MASVYALLSEFPSADSVASAHLIRLSHLLSESSRGSYGKETASLFQEAARNSIGSVMPIWKSEVPNTFDMPFTIPQNMSAIRTNPSAHMLEKKHSEGKYYNVALSHAAKKCDSFKKLHFLLDF